MFLLLFFFGMASAASGQTFPLNKQSLHRLHGKIGILHESVVTEAKIGDSVESGSAKIETITTFDALERVLNVQVIKDNELFSTLVYDYVGESMAPVRAVDYNADKSVYLIIEYKYDTNGRVTGEVYDRSWQKTFDKQREPVELEFYKYYEVMFSSIQLKQEFTGRITEQVFTKDDGTTAYKYQFTYDFRGSLKSTKYYNAFGRVVWRTVNTYDRYQRLKQQRMFMDNILTMVTDYTYELDAHENWIVRRADKRVMPNIYTKFVQGGVELTTLKLIYFLKFYITDRQLSCTRDRFFLFFCFVLKNNYFYSR